MVEIKYIKGVIESMYFKQPETIPPVRPVPEYEAKGELKEIYEELKKDLGVPWVGVITQALAFYEPFFKEAWRQLKPSVKTNFFEEHCNQIRLHSWNGVIESFTNKKLAAQLRELGYKDREIEEIQEMLDVLDYGNPKYLVFATVVKHVLLNGKISGKDSINPLDVYPRPQVTSGYSSLVMVEEHHASEGLTKIYEDIKHTLNLPFVNSDYKAQGRWPSYLELAWNDLKPNIDTEDYISLRNQINQMAYEMTENLPYSYTLDKDKAYQLEMNEKEVNELIEVISLFQYLLSGLIINVSYFKAGIS
jgi:hypothetical protein